MKSFEEHLRRAEYARSCKERFALKKRADREWTREERRTKQEQLMNRITAICLLVLAVIAVVVSLVSPAGADSTPVSKAVREPQIAESVEVVEPEPIQEDYENEKIAAALVESGYFRSDIPMDYELQAYLRAACEESGAPFELALAVIWKETGYRNVTGDGGDSIGYMQVQPQWHQERMRRLGVDDLSHPFANFRVGCDYLAELLDKYSAEEALTAYNSGKPGKSQYARDVLEYWYILKYGEDM